MPLLASFVDGNAISFDLASWGTALTLRLRVSFHSNQLRSHSGIPCVSCATLTSAFICPHKYINETKKTKKS